MKTTASFFGILYFTLCVIQAQNINLFSVSPDTSCAPTAVFFSAITNDALSYAWNFGNGQTSNQKQATPISSYPVGNYRINMTITTNITDKLVDNLTITTIPNTWNDGLGIDPVPDLYFIVKDAVGSTIYTSHIIPDKAVPVTFNSTFLMKSGMNYTVELWEYDLIGQNDFLAYIPLSNSPSSGTFTNGGGALTLTTQTNRTSYTSFRDVVVMNVPTVSLTQTNGVLTATMNTAVGAPFTYNWFLNNTLITGNNFNNPTFTPTVSGVYRVEVYNRFSCRAVSQNLNFTRVGAHDLPEGLTVQMGPNPTSNIVEVQLNFPNSFQKTDKLIVSDILGRQVLAITHVEASNRLDISRFANGIYLLHFKLSDKVYTLGKIVKQ